MAYIATIKILVDEANEASVYDGINEILRNAQMGGPNGEDRGWVVDWKFESVEPASESLNKAITDGAYAEGDAFGADSSKAKAYVLVEVKGGVAEVTRTSGDVEVTIVDWDNIKAGDSLDAGIQEHPVFGQWIDADLS